MSFVLADHFRWQKHLLNLKDHQGNTALHVAVIEGMTEPVQVLLQAGADINTLGVLSFTPALLGGSSRQRFDGSVAAHLNFHVQTTCRWWSRHVAMSGALRSWSACQTLCTSMQQMKQHKMGRHECIQSDATADMTCQLYMHSGGHQSAKRLYLT